MTYAYTPYKVLDVYRTSNGYRFDKEESVVYKGKKRIADNADFWNHKGDGIHPPIVDELSKTSVFVGYYGDDDIVAVRCEEIQTALYERHQDRPASYWSSIFMQYEDELPLLSKARVDNSPLLHVFDSTNCGRIALELTNLRYRLAVVEFSMLLEVFTLASNHGGLVQYG